MSALRQGQKATCTETGQHCLPHRHTADLICGLGGGGSLPEYANHVDPAPAALRAEKWRNKNTELSEEEMEAVMVRNNPCPHRQHPPGALLLTRAECSLVQLGDWNLS